MIYMNMIDFMVLICEAFYFDLGFYETQGFFQIT